MISKKNQYNKLGFFILSCLFIVLNTVFEPSQLPTIHLLGGIDLGIIDIFYLLLLIMAFKSRIIQSTTAISSPLSKYMIIFLCIIILIVGYSILILHQPASSVFANIRTFIGYSMFFPVIWCLGTLIGVKRVIKLWATLSVLGALLFIYEFYFGELSIFKHSWLYSRISDVTTGGVNSIDLGYHRALSQGTVLFRIMLFVAISMWLFLEGKARFIWGSIALLLSFQVILQFTRGMYLTTLISLLLMIVAVGNRRARVRLFAVLLGTIFLIINMSLYKAGVGLSIEDQGVTGFAQERFIRIFTQGTSDASIVSRFTIYDTLSDAMKGHWFFGFGLGSGLVYGDNTYISLLFKTGLIGLLGFIIFYTVVIYRGYKGYRLLIDPWQKALVLGLWISTLRHLINGLSQADFTSNIRIPALVISVALMEIIFVRFAETKNMRSSKALFDHPKKEVLETG